MVKNIHFKLEDDLYYKLLEEKAKMKIDSWKEYIFKLRELSKIEELNAGGQINNKEA